MVAVARAVASLVVGTLGAFITHLTHRAVDRCASQPSQNGIEFPICAPPRPLYLLLVLVGLGLAGLTWFESGKLIQGRHKRLPR